MTVSKPKNSMWSGWIVLVAILLVPIAGCTNPNPAPAEGSWIEILEIEESPDALDVETLDSFRSVEVLEDRLIFTFDGSSPLRVEHVVAGSGRDFPGYLRRVVAVNQLADGRIEAMTEAAVLSDYYPKLDFIFHYDPVRVAEPTYVDMGGDVGAAMEAETNISCADTAPCRAGASQKWGNDTAGCSASAEGEIYMGPFVETDFKAEFKFGAGESGIGWTGIRLKPDAYAVLGGDVRAGVQFSGSAGAMLSCNADFAALIGGGEAPKIQLAFLQIGPIPVTVNATPVLEGQFTAAADVGEFSAEAGVEASANAEFGIKGGDPHMEQDFTFDSFADVTTARAGSLSAEGSMKAGVIVELQVGYDFGFKVAGVGATVDLGAKATMELTGTLGLDMTADFQGCAWNVDIPWSCDVQFGVGIDAVVKAGPFEVGWTPKHEWDPINIAMGSLGSLSGELPWCGMAPSMCTEGGPTCHDDAFDNSVCEGMMGFQSCGAGQVQYCTCTASGWADCSACMDN